MIQASDLISGSAKSRSGPMSAQRNLHGYDGPLQFLSPAGNPDEMTTVQVGLQMTLNYLPRGLFHRTLWIHKLKICNFSRISALNFYKKSKIAVSMASVTRLLDYFSICGRTQQWDFAWK